MRNNIVNSFGILLFRYSRKNKWKVLIVKKKYSYYVFDFIKNENNLSIKDRENMISKLTKHDIMYINNRRSNNRKIENLHPAENLWEIPKGRSRRNETNLISAIREFKEETSIQKNDYKLLGPRICCDIFDGQQYRFNYYIAITEKKCIDKKVLDSREIDDIKWVTISDINFYYGGNIILKAVDKGINVLNEWNKFKYE